MKTYTDSEHGFKIDIPDDWVVDNYKLPIIARALFRLIFRGPQKNAMAFVRGSNEMLETLNISVEKMSPDISPELTRYFFVEYARQSGYAITNFGRILLGETEHTCVRYQIAENVWSKKYMLVFHGMGYAITTCFRNIGFPFEKEREWDIIVNSFRLI